MKSTLLRKINCINCRWFLRCVRSKAGSCFRSTSKTVNWRQCLRRALERWPEPEEISIAMGCCSCFGTRFQLLKSLPSTSRLPKLSSLFLPEDRWTLGWFGRRWSNDEHFLLSPTGLVSAPPPNSGAESEHLLRLIHVGVDRCNSDHGSLADVWQWSFRKVRFPASCWSWKGFDWTSVLS